MPKRCVPCFSDEVKQILRQLNRPDINTIISGLATCTSEPSIQLCSKGKGGRGKSEYNVFIGKCIKEPGKSSIPITERMRGCASEWRKR